MVGPTVEFGWATGRRRFAQRTIGWGWVVGLPGTGEAELGRTGVTGAPVRSSGPGSAGGICAVGSLR